MNNNFLFYDPSCHIKIQWRRKDCRKISRKTSREEFHKVFFFILVSMFRRIRLKSPVFLYIAKYQYKNYMHKYNENIAERNGFPKNEIFE